VLTRWPLDILPHAPMLLIDITNPIIYAFNAG
jgi:hypothetical protein